MKKTILLSALLCLATMGFAQFDLGVKVGANFSKLSTDISTLKTSMQPGVDVGAFARIGFAKKWYFGPEVLYSFESTKFKDMGDDIKANSHNIIVPLLFGYKILDMKLVNLRVFAGPELGFLIGDDYPNGYDASNVNIAADLGVGVDIAMIAIDLKYAFGINKSASINDLDWNPHSNLFAISVGWKFL